MFPIVGECNITDTTIDHLITTKHLRASFAAAGGRRPLHDWFQRVITCFDSKVFEDSLFEVVVIRP